MRKAKASANTPFPPTRVLVSRVVQRGIERAEFRAVDPDVVVDALVLPIIATCLHRHAIGPHVPCEFIAADQQALARYMSRAFAAP